MKGKFEDVIKKFQSKKTKSYDLLIKGGADYQNSFYKLCERIIMNEEIPSSFHKTVLHMIGKKGPADILKNNRFIHMKDFLPRTCEALVVNVMKEDIIENSSIYQVGGQPGHSIEEHLFTIKKFMLLLEQNKEGMVLTLVDIIAFYDRENIFDVMDTLNTIGVNKK